MSTQTPPGHFTHSDVQDLLDAAHIEVGRRYVGTPHLCEMLQSQLKQGVEDCNLRVVDPMQLLHEQMRDERRVLDAYNKHRLGKASYRYYKSMKKSENDVKYDEADNIPELLEWFPLRSKVAERGFHIQALPIYQVSGTVDHNQEIANKTTITSKTAFKKKVFPTKAANDKASPSKKKTGRGASTYDKLADAPSAQLAFPTGNITLAELTAFLPQSIKSWNVIDRALFNGAMSVTFAGMINHFRTMPNGPIENNSIYRMMKGPMDKRALQDVAYKGWSVSAHQKLKKPNDFDPTSVSVAGYRTPVNYDRRADATATQVSAPTILFRDLMKGVKIMPSGDDALDLTRCVQHCIDHPDEDWFYPQDFEALVSHLPPYGPSPVRRSHHDGSIIARYTSTQKLNGAIQTMNRQRDGHGRLQKQDVNSNEEEDAMGTISDDFDSKIDLETLDKKGPKRRRTTISAGADKEDASLRSRSTKRTKPSPMTPSRSGFSHSTAASVHLRRQATATVSNVDFDSDSDVYQGPKKMKKKNWNVAAPPRTSGRTKRYSGSYNIDAALDDDQETVDDDGFA
ncbi:Nn.00g030050.m01.CDS01 [Neocucurbitaria sp. VM-36]